MSQWNLAAISIGCLIIMISNQMENGKPWMFFGSVIAGIALSRFFRALKIEKQKSVAKSKDVSKKGE